MGETLATQGCFWCQVGFCGGCYLPRDALGSNTRHVDVLPFSYSSPGSIAFFQGCRAFPQAPWLPSGLWGLPTDSHCQLPIAVARVPQETPTPPRLLTPHL